jgi:hypothetical protein
MIVKEVRARLLTNGVTLSHELGTRGSFSTEPSDVQTYAVNVPGKTHSSRLEIDT